MAEIMNAEEMKNLIKSTHREEIVQKYVAESIERLKRKIMNGKDLYAVVQSGSRYGISISDNEVMKALEKLGYRRYTEPVISGGVRQIGIFFTV